MLARLGVVASLTLGAAVAPAQAQLPVLHATRGSAAAIVDSAGRQVLLRGVDLTALQENYQQYPNYPATTPANVNDLREMAGLGFNVIRLVLNWSELEPTPGSFNLAYVQQIHQIVNWAGANGIYVVLDMHEDSWGISVGASPGESCPPATSALPGSDGAPAWATLTDGLTRCAPAGEAPFSLADEAAFQNFYDNTDGIQTQLIDTWTKLVAQFAANPVIAGYDLFNEPNPGLDFDEASGGLGDYYTHVLSAIRATESATPGGFHHIAFFEPGVEWALEDASANPQGAFTQDSNIVFSPHLYQGSIDPGTVAQAYSDAAAGAKRYGTTIWAGEYGWYGTPAGDEADIAAFAADQDAHLWGGAWWQWKQSCGAPGSVGTFGAAVPQQTNSLVRITCTPGPLQAGPLVSTSALGIPLSTERILDRATVHAAPGAFVSLASDPTTGSFSMSGTGAPATGTGLACTLTGWVPGSGRPRFATTGISTLSTERVRGGYDLSACAHGSYSLRLVSRAPAGLGCAAALNAGTPSLRGARLGLRIAESRRAESRCAGRITLTRGGRRIGSQRFSLSPGTARHLAIRTDRARLQRGSRRLRVIFTGVDVDANRFRHALARRLNRAGAAV